MKKKYQTLYCVIFLLIISSVPVVQTIYEMINNDGHRIQMLDLLEDLFVTPSKNADATTQMIDSLNNTVNQLDLEMRNGLTSAAGFNTLWNKSNLINYIDESVALITLLKQKVIQYNRHLQGDHNKFYAQDTSSQYYQMLISIDNGLSNLMSLIKESENGVEIKKVSEQLKRNAEALTKLTVYKVGFADYFKLTGIAMSRILVGADYLRPYEKEMEKSSVFANTIRPQLSTCYYALFGDLGSKGMAGKNDWLFYRSDIDYLVKPCVLEERSRIVDANDVPFTESIVDSIVAFRDMLAKKGIDLLFVSMPTKGSIYPEVLASGSWQIATDKEHNTRRMLKALEMAGVQTVNLLDAFAEEKKHDQETGDSLYMRTDTHFKKRGVLTTAKAVAQRVRNYSWYKDGFTEYTVDSLTIERYGDIAEMSKLPEMVDRLKRKPFPVELTECLQVYQIQRDSSGVIESKILYKDDFKNAQIIVIGDSFTRIFQTDQPKSAGWVSHLAKELNQPLVSIANDGGASTLVRQVLARKPQLLKNKKLVIWEVVERDFRFGEQGWKNVAIR